MDNIKIRQFIRRIRDSFRVLFSDKSYCIIEIDRDNLLKHLKGETFETKISFNKLQLFNVKKILHELSNEYDSLDNKLLEIETIENYKESKGVEKS